MSFVSACCRIPILDLLCSLARTGEVDQNPAISIATPGTRMLQEVGEAPPELVHQIADEVLPVWDSGGGGFQGVGT